MFISRKTEAQETILVVVLGLGEDSLLHIGAVQQQVVRKMIANPEMCNSNSDSSVSR